MAHDTLRIVRHGGSQMPSTVQPTFEIRVLALAAKFDESAYASLTLKRLRELGARVRPMVELND